MATNNYEIELYTFDCTGCESCQKICIAGVFKMIDNGMCQFVNVIDETSCIGCGRCEAHCPSHAIKIINKKELIKQL